jgi:hypothetical protein
MLNTWNFRSTCFQIFVAFHNYLQASFCWLGVKKVKVALRVFSIPRPFGSIVFLPEQVPAFISRGATHHTDARDLYQRRGELFPPDFASRSVIYKNPLGSFTSCKAGTWDILFYFLSEGRHTEDFPDARKIQPLRPGLNQRTRVPVNMTGRNLDNPRNLSCIFGQLTKIK